MLFAHIFTGRKISLKHQFCFYMFMYFFLVQFTTTKQLHCFSKKLHEVYYTNFVNFKRLFKKKYTFLLSCPVNGFSSSEAKLSQNIFSSTNDFVNLSS